MKTVTCKFKNREWATLRRLARSCGLNVSEYIRRMTLRSPAPQDEYGRNVTTKETTIES